MDESRFDQLTTVLAEAVGRRGILAATLGLAALGSTLNQALGTGDNTNKNKQRRRKRRRTDPGAALGDQQDCSGVLKKAGCRLVNDKQLGLDKWYCQPGTNLLGVNLTGCRLAHAVLDSVNLQLAFLSRAILDDGSLRQADLFGATMTGTSSVRTNYTSANLYKARMGEADVRYAIFEDADVRLNDWGRATCPDAVVVTGPRRDCCANLNGSTPRSCGVL